MLAWLREQIKHVGSSLHRPVYRATGGRFVGSYRGIPILLLTTTGRKSGKPRTWPLLYFRNEERYILIASNWGQDHHPAWLLNLREHPHATIEIGRHRTAITAEESTGEERERLWKGAARAYPGYIRYQSRTNREIPVVILIPG